MAPADVPAPQAGVGDLQAVCAEFKRVEAGLAESYREVRACVHHRPSGRLLCSLAPFVPEDGGACRQTC